MTDEERILLYGECPDCNTRDLHLGPSGGMSINFACFTCGQRYNAAFMGAHNPGAMLNRALLGIAFLERTDRINGTDRPLFKPERFRGLLEPPAES